MPAVAQVTIHFSQFPQSVRRDLLESLRTRQVNHKFHYDSVKQAQQWLALHQAYSPSRTDPDCAAIYDQSFAAAAPRLRSKRVHLVGLGCGGGQKDTRLIQRLHDLGKEVFYTPSDVSTAMVLVARQSALGVLPPEKCTPFVCDLASSEDLPAIIGESAPADALRLITFFGMLPNFEPGVILPRLAALVGPGDYLLLSANLAPGSDYAAGVRCILPLYDNTLTRDWLMTFLLDTGIERDDGTLRFVVEPDPDGLGLRRVAAYFEFVRPREIHVDEKAFAFGSGDEVRLFFSYRHTPELVRSLLGQHGLQVLDQWVAPSEEEGVFLASRAP
ncbi:MAG TPA: L-histidine N(alpha)-methyltransferase [Candidatus Acidoferrum sp.]|nr:L-histidine N(alpha)-methyltransferase [Candidatus Acidoferrum sp.]